MSIATATKAVAVALAASFLLCQAALASLGLGEARVQSFLGQNLAVEIALVRSGETELDSLQVTVASAEDHARLGVPSEALALGLSATLDLSVEPPVIRLRSSRPVTDPFAQVLIDARWASGRMLREYTLFLDPPAVPLAPPIRRTEERPAAAPEQDAGPTPERSPESVAPPEPDAQAEPEPRPEPARQTTPTAPVPEAPSRTEPDPAALETVVAERGDTLWSIAAQWRPDPDLTMSQAMLAIFDRNPEAFIANNVNRLRRGARLTLPGVDDARAIAPAEAARRFREQTQAWEAGRASAVAVRPEPQPEPEPEPAEASAPPDPAPAESEPAAGDDPVDAANDAAPEEVTEPASSAADQTEPQPRLELTPPDEDLLGEASVINAERQRLGDRLAELESEMALDGLESPDTDALVDQIRQAIDSADAGGLMVASEDLAQLEEQLREARQAREAEQQAEEAAVTPVEPPSSMTSGPLATAPVPFVERWLWPLAGGIAGLLVLLVALGLVRRRAARRSDETPVENAGQPDLSVAESAAAGATPSNQGPDHADREAEAALMGILGRDEEDDDPGRGEAETSPPPAAEDDDSQDAPDLARLSNRLDPHEADEPSSEPAGTEALALEDEDLDALFAREQTSPDTPDEADAGPLTLEFELPAEDDVDDAASEPLREMASEEPEAEPGQEESPDSVRGDPVFDPEGETPSAPEPDRAFDAGQTDIEPFSAGDELATDAPVGDQLDWFAVGGEDDELGEGADGPPDGPAEERESESDASTEPAAVLGDEDAEVKLDLARAYMSMEDPDSARVLLDEVISDGSPAHREQAQKLLDTLR
ncbi:MAG: FimV/HubP family polar landmark protein [Wenzhouxiangella sp.]